jgi:hypothetical protein
MHRQRSLNAAQKREAVTAERNLKLKALAAKQGGARSARNQINGDTVVRVAYANCGIRRKCNGFDRWSQTTFMDTVAGRILKDQQEGLSVMDATCAQFRGEVDLSMGGKNLVVRGASRQGDETHQRFALDTNWQELVSDDAVHDVTVNVVAPCCVRLGRLSWTFLGRRGSKSTTTQPWVMSPLVSQNSVNGRITLEANTRNWPLKLTAGLWTQTRSTCDVLVDCFTSDSHPINKAQHKYEASSVKDEAAIVSDRKDCNVHNTHGAFRRCLATVKVYSRHFQFWRLFQSSTQAGKLQRKFDDVIAEDLVVLARIRPPVAFVERICRQSNPIFKS